MNQLKEYIKKARKENKITQKELSKLAKVEEGIIKKLEQKNIISDDTALLRIARCLKLDPLILFDKSELEYSQARMKNFEILSGNSCIKTIYCGSWDSFINYYTEKMFESVDENLIWRGHKDSGWKLESTLLREYQDGITEEMISLIIKKFKKSTLGNTERIEMEKLKDGIKIEDADEEKEKMLWLSLGQHHGLKTPLLDWTYSPYVASYFAYVDSQTTSSYRVIYALDRDALKLIIKKTGEDIKIIESENHFNKRLLNQQGLFIYGPFEYDLETWLEENCFVDKKIILYKFMIPNSDRKMIMKMLNKMNINPKSLFPDLTGASNHVNLEIELI